MWIDTNKNPKHPKTVNPRNQKRRIFPCIQYKFKEHHNTMHYTMHSTMHNTMQLYVTG